MYIIHCLLGDKLNEKIKEKRKSKKNNLDLDLFVRNYVLRMNYV